MGESNVWQEFASRVSLHGTSSLNNQMRYGVDLLVDELGEVLVSHLFYSALAMVELEDQKLGTFL